AAQAAAVTRLGQTAVAVGRAATFPGAPADQAVAWTSGDGHTWSPTNPLDAIAGAGIEDPHGVCAGPQSVVAVGSAITSGPGRQALAWSSSDGVHWQAGTVNPTPDPSADESMQSCITTGNGYIAFGSTQGADGSIDAAVWYSNNGATWTRQTVDAFAGSGLGPIKDLAVGGTTWLAVSGNDDHGGASDRNLGVWRTTDAGSSWQRIDTTGAPWTASQTASVDRVALNGPNAVVAGQIDGRLAVWLGTPPGTAAPSTSSTTTPVSVPPSSAPAPPVPPSPATG
ncbi:MAG: glycoside hydrolase, partial [Actinomycetota bacterium]|nr:glycoside hydrolase [Actinomycetota bacterium]